MKELVEERHRWWYLKYQVMAGDCVQAEVECHAKGF
jgi:hypothetical protein